MASDPLVMLAMTVRANRFLYTQAARMETRSIKMAFSDGTKALALVRANNQCECNRWSHTHAGRCTTKLTSTNTEYHHKTAVASGGGDGFSNCEVLCRTCHALIPKPS